MSNSVRPQRQQPTRLRHPWDSPGKNAGVGCHYLLQCMKGKSESKVAQLCPTLSDPMDCSLPGSSVHGIFQASVLEWVAIAFSSYLSRIRQMNGMIFCCCCSVTQLYPTLCNPMDCSMPGFPVLYHPPEFAQTHVHWVSDVIQPSHPLLPPFPALNLSQHQGIFPVNQLFTSGSQSIGSSASVFPMNI